ncbi:Rieske 2Fe-2S domain-containing protein, partial [Actinomadura adrarensis]
VAGRRVALWRGESGRIFAWEDRCPHRGMRLSFGFVRDEKLACIYHGWAFDFDGRCVAIPAHPEMTPPASISVPAYPVAESHGMVWVGESDEDATVTAADQEFRPVRSITAAVPAADLESVLDGTPPPGMQRVEAPGLVAFESGHGIRVVAGIQPRTENSASAHVAVSGEDPELRKALCAWAVEIRSSARGRAEEVAVP